MKTRSIASLGVALLMLVASEAAKGVTNVTDAAAKAEFIHLVASEAAKGVTNVTDAAAKAEFIHFKKLVTSRNFVLMGFGSTGEVKTATLSMDPINIHQVRLNDLRLYQRTVNPGTLLQSPDMRVYPVMVNNQTRSAITFGAYPTGWKVVSYGYPNLAKTLTTARAASATATGLPLEQFFAVQVRALNVIFLGHYKNGKLILSPLADDAGLGLAAGNAKPAEQVFSALVPAAQQHNGLPR